MVAKKKNSDLSVTLHMFLKNKVFMYYQCNENVIIKKDDNLVLKRLSSNSSFATNFHI